MSTGNALQTSLNEWLERNIGEFLSTIRNDFSEDYEWQMPVVEDFVLVVAVKDLSDDGYGVFKVARAGTPVYRVNGLLGEAME